jgi:hypothetical protein
VEIKRCKDCEYFLKKGRKQDCFCCYLGPLTPIDGNGAVPDDCPWEPVDEREE